MELITAIKTLNDWFDTLNKRFFENTLSKPIITIQTDPKGSCYGWVTTRQIWDDDGTMRYEINIVAETLNRPVHDVATTLLHEMAHLSNIQKGVQDCSRGGTYHNKKFKAEAERVLLEVTPSQKYGYAHTAPTPDLITFFNAHGIAERITLNRRPQIKLPNEKKSNVRKYMCIYCGISCRATKDINISCNDCGCSMILANPSNDD